MRDSQRQRLYDAETMVRDVLDSLAQADVPTFDFYGSSLLVPLERKFGDLESIQRYIDAVLALNWVRDTWPERTVLPVRVRKRKGKENAHYEPLTRTLAVPDHTNSRGWAMREIVILHELAHHLDMSAEHHGPVFASTFLHLVREVMGPEVGLLLTDSFTRHGVAFGVLATV
ncbi:TIGR04338 family metallohydrolase [Streptomyces sp. NPDC059468]|uniref:TIGR04338 family metallohydrolase n=1 Tax=Streptomyces sp. NPDC059468 TaxID=3346845 RepID=UPI0036AC3084